MWDHLIEQAFITLNLLRQSQFHPHLSTWTHYNDALNYDDTPMDPMGYREMIHEPEKLRSSWGFNAAPGYCVGPALNHYRCFAIFPIKIRTPRIGDTIEFRHDHITVPHATLEEKVTNAITKLKQDLAATPSPNSIHQLTAIKQIKSLFSKHQEKQSSINNNVDALNTINGTSTDSLSRQHHFPVKSIHPLTPKVKIHATNKNLASLPRV